MKLAGTGSPLSPDWGGETMSFSRFPQKHGPTTCDAGLRSDKLGLSRKQSGLLNGEKDASEKKSLQVRLEFGSLAKEQ